MTIINPNSISGISSLTAQASEMNFYRSDGSLAGLNLNGVNFNTTSGISTFADLKVGGTLTYEDVKNIDSIGIVTARDDIRIITDNKKLKIGAGDDLNLYHDGSKSVIADTGTGGLFVAGSSISLTDAGITETMLYAAPNGAVELYYDNSKKFETRSDGVLVSGNIQLNDSNRLDLGNNGDLRLYHDGSNSYMKDVGTGALYIDGSSVRFRNYANSETMAEFIGDGEVKLYYNNSKKFETTSSGVTVTGDFVTSGNVDLADSTGGSNNRIKLGTGDDLQVYHDGSNGYVYNSGSGHLILQGNGSNNVNIRGKNGENGIIVKSDGNVELYYDNVKKFGTRVNGVDIIGNTYIADNDKISFGGSSDLLIYHDGSSNVIETTSNTKIGKSGEASAWFNPDGNVQLFYDNSKKFETNSVGVFVKSTIQIEEASGSEYYRLHTNGYGGLEIQNETTKVCEFTDASTLDFPDNTKIQLGTGQDIKIYHDGTHSYIRNDTNQFYCQAQNNFYIQHHNAGSAIEDMLIARGDGAVELYYDNVKKFETISSGVQVYGDLQLQGGDGDTQSLYWDKSDYILKFKDNIHAEWGNSRDLQIYHDGTDSRIKGTTGQIIIQSDDLLLRNEASSENYLRAQNNGSVELYCDNHLKFYTDNSASGTIIYDDQHNTTTSLVFRLRKNAAGTSTSVRQHMMSFSVPGNNRGLAQSGSSATEAPIWAGYSDYRVKTNFRPYTGGWDAIKAIPVQLYDEDQPNYEPFDPASNQTNKKGWKAHEVQAVMPEAVTGEKDAVVTQAMIDAGEYKQEQLGNIIPQYLGTTAMIPTIIGALQQAMEKIETLENKVAVLESS